MWGPRGKSKAYSFLTGRATVEQQPKAKKNFQTRRRALIGEIPIWLVEIGNHLGTNSAEGKVGEPRSAHKQLSMGSEIGKILKA
jgi:hypothetical protein